MVSYLGNLLENETMDLIQEILYQKIYSNISNPIQSRYIAFMLSSKECVTDILEVSMKNKENREYLIKTDKGSFVIELCNIDIPNTKISYVID